MRETFFIVVAGVVCGALLGYSLGVKDGHRVSARHGIDATIAEIERQATERR